MWRFDPGPCRPCRPCRTPSLGNTTLQRVAAGDTVKALPVLELTRPGVHRQGNWSVHDVLAFWDGLPLLENKEPPR